MQTLIPERAIVPILRGDINRPATELLGTGFFVGPENSRHLVTAKHVFEASPLTGNQHFAFALRVDQTVTVHRISKVLAMEDFDVAVCPITGVDNIESLKFSHVKPGLNDDVFSFEYSSTRFEATQEGGLHVIFEPLAHKGNVMRFYTSTFPEKHETPTLQVSYPALQGASGAPVLASNSSNQFYVTGMLVANIERELLPAQIVRIEDGEEYLEETKYFLPHGKALNGKLICKFLADLGVADLHVDDAA